MSFSSNVKEEISKINIFSNEDNVKAELYGYMLTVNSNDKEISFLTENEYNINRLNKLLNRLDINYTIKMNGKNYEIKFKKEDLQIDNAKFINHQEMEKAIVRGAFLGGGSITDPNTRYHLEIRLKEEKRKR